MIVVTGGRGVVGQPLCTRLVKSELDFVAVSRHLPIPNSQELIADDTNWLRWDLGSPLAAAHTKRLKGVRCLMHCAPLWTLRNESVESLAALGLQRIVAFSSTSIEGKKDTRDPHEARLVGLLADSEERIKAICAQLGISLTLLRPSLIYGYGLDQNISKIAHTIQRFGVMVLVGKGSGLRQPVHADDLVTAALAVISNPITYGKTYNVVGGETLSYRLMVVRIFACMGRRPRIISVPLWALRAVLTFAARFSKFAYTADMADRMNKDLVYDQRAAVADFAYTPRKFYPQLGIDIPGQRHD